LHHPNVVKMLEIFDDTFKNNVYLVMEYIEGSEILEEIATQQQGYTE
jgi:serine/threonine protein kinase